MNFLAHSYLSFNLPGILIGNMISDFVKGKKKFEYDLIIQTGIALHRSIDAFTDEHEATRQAKVYLKPAAGLYSGAFIDVAYDHFLANDANEFTDASLHEHAASTYTILQEHVEVLPEKFRSMLPYMQLQNWLYNYKTLSGLKSSFGGVVRRAKYLSSSNETFNLFERHYDVLQEHYRNFFPFVKAFSAQKLKELLNS